MKKILLFIKYFFYITTGILIVVALNFALSDEETLPRDTLWQILASGALTAAITAVLSPQDSRTFGGFAVKCALHYAALCVVMILCGHSFGWLSYDLGGIAMMALSVSLVYLFTFFSYYIMDRKQADDINRRLREKYRDEEEV